MRLAFVLYLGRPRSVKSRNYITEWLHWLALLGIHRTRRSLAARFKHDATDWSIGLFRVEWPINKCGADDDGISTPEGEDANYTVRDLDLGIRTPQHIP